jgi:DNA-binding transcriptional LysR family regulator
VELRQLEQFLAVVEEGSFTGAAARLYTAQSSLSASLLGLERELGTELFIRGRRGAELTDAGRALLGPARAAIEEVALARDAVAEVRGLLQGVVRVATVVVPRRVDVVETIRQIIDFPRGWWIRDLFDRLVEDRGQRREVRLEVNEWFGVLSMVQRGVGISYGPRACLEDAVGAGYGGRHPGGRTAVGARGRHAGRCAARSGRPRLPRRLPPAGPRPGVGLTVRLTQPPGPAASPGRGSCGRLHSGSAQGAPARCRERLCTRRIRAARRPCRRQGAPSRAVFMVRRRVVTGPSCVGPGSRSRLAGLCTRSGERCSPGRAASPDEN